MLAHQLAKLLLEGPDQLVIIPLVASDFYEYNETQLVHRLDFNFEEGKVLIR